jgi:predicted MFS family arabinose efflux permease
MSALALIIGNIMSMNATDYDTFFWSRVISGSGQGIGYSLGLVGMSVTANPGRNFGYMIAALNIWLITWFVLLPGLMDSFGMAALYNFFIFASVLCLVAFWFFPNNGRLDKDKQVSKETGGATHDKKHYVVPMLWVGGAFLVYSFSLGIIYPYVEIIGASMNASTDDIGLVLAAGSLLAVVGAVLTAVVDQKYSHVVIMVFVGIINAVVCFGMAWTDSTVIFLVLSCIYIMAWNVAYARYYTALATTDRSGYFSSYGPEIGTVGIAMGPMLAQALTATGDFQGQVGIGAVTIVVATVMVTIGMRHSKKVNARLDSEVSAA